VSRLPDLVVIVWDTVRASDVSLGDGPAADEPETTPVLRRLADSADVYTRCGSVSPWTLPSHASLFTGLLPTQHGANETHYRLEPGPATLAELLERRGYLTIAVCANDMVSAPSGLARGFRRFLPTADVFPRLEEHPRTPRYVRAAMRRLDHAYGRNLRHRRDHGAARVNRFVDRALARAPRDRPVLLFVNVIDAHLPYRPPEPHRSRFLPPGMPPEEAATVNQNPRAFFTGRVAMGEREFAALRGLYRGGIAYLDARLEELVRILRRRGRWDSAVVALTSDHGENIGDHGLMDHQASVNETLLGVPLVVKGPGARAGRRIDHLVQTHDLAPTLLAQAGTAFEDPVHARVLPQDGGPGRDVAVSEYVRFFLPLDPLRRTDPGLDLSRLERGLRSARDGADLKLIAGTDGSEELFDLRADPGETRNVASERPGDVERLREHLPRWDPAPVAPEPDQLQNEIEDRLRSLGYLE
jgi:arylsulfatase A-like enzyme